MTRNKKGGKNLHSRRLSIGFRTFQVLLKGHFVDDCALIELHEGNVST